MATVTYWERASEESPAVLLLLASPVVLSLSYEPLGRHWAAMSVDGELVGDPGSQKLVLAIDSYFRTHRCSQSVSLEHPPHLGRC